MTDVKIKVGVLGATGTVGQRFILQLSSHPVFELAALGASSSSAGKSYYEAVSGRWKQMHPIPSQVRNMPVHECVPGEFSECSVVFSGLDSGLQVLLKRHFVRPISACSRTPKTTAATLFVL